MSQKLVSFVFLQNPRIETPFFLKKHIRDCQKQKLDFFSKSENLEKILRGEFLQNLNICIKYLIEEESNLGGRG